MEEEPSSRLLMMTVIIFTIIMVTIMIIHSCHCHNGDDNRKNLDEMETEQVGPSTKSFTPFVGVGNHHHHLPSPSPSPLLN